MSPNLRKSHWQLSHTYTSLPEVFYSLQQPIAVTNPEVVCFNEGLAEELGLGYLNEESDQLAGYFSGNELPEGSQSLAMAYAGHQFGHFTMLGDGRAILLGEQVDPAGNRFDLQLKGSGQTPYSRRGDGRATLYAMLREYLISEAMHHLGIPTTRSLAVVTTGEQVFRGEAHQGAVLTRTAASHIRVGTFEFARNYGSLADLQALTSYTIQRHYPEIADAENPALELLRVVMHKQIDLVVNWLRVGFIHGVMNTDNMSIAGETIDYGPCAFMNAYSPKTVFSSIDTGGRYAFGNQSFIVKWNITAFANALLPLLSDQMDTAIELAKGVIAEFDDRFLAKWYAMMFAKLGILQPEEGDKSLVDELLSLMEANGADYTQVFLALQQDKPSDAPFFQQADFHTWQQRWKTAQLRKGEEAARIASMRKHNPSVIPRNHWVETALKAAVEGNMTPLKQLLELLSHPYADHPDQLTFEPIPTAFDARYQTFCGT